MMAPKLLGPNVRTSIVYYLTALVLSQFVSVTRENNKDHLWMLICVGLSMMPLVILLPSAWWWLKPRRPYFSCLGLFVAAGPLIIFGHYFMDFVIDVFFKGYFQLGSSF